MYTSGLKYKIMHSKVHIKILLHIAQLFLIPKGITNSKLTLLQYPMTLLQGPKDPVLPNRVEWQCLK